MSRWWPRRSGKASAELGSTNSGLRLASVERGILTQSGRSPHHLARLRLTSWDQLMQNHCCERMESAIRTPSQRQALLNKRGFSALELGMLGERPGPTIEFSNGCYAIRGTLIFNCPWCGTKLPRTPAGAKDAINIAVTPDGTITVNGKPLADEDDILAAIDREGGDNGLKS